MVPAVVSVKSRSVVAAGPVYWRVPPASTRFAATLVDAPMPLTLPPIASEETLRMPPMIVVMPVYVFAPLSVSVPVPTLERESAPRLHL